jgi:hypothetical protein
MERWTSRVLEYMDHDRDHDARGGRVGMCLWGRVEEELLYYSSVQYRQSSNSFHFHIAAAAGEYDLTSHGARTFLCIRMKLDEVAGGG